MGFREDKNAYEKSRRAVFLMPTNPVGGKIDSRRNLTNQTNEFLKTQGTIQEDEESELHINLKLDYPEPRTAKKTQKFRAFRHSPTPSSLKYQAKIENRSVLRALKQGIAKTGTVKRNTRCKNLSPIANFRSISPAKLASLN